MAQVTLCENDVQKLVKSMEYYVSPSDGIYIHHEDMEKILKDINFDESNINKIMSQLNQLEYHYGEGCGSPELDNKDEYEKAETQLLEILSCATGMDQESFRFDNVTFPYEEWQSRIEEEYSDDEEDES